MVILQFLIGILIASLAGMGVGGGGLLVIWLIFIANMSAPTAQGINLVFFRPPSHIFLKGCAYITISTGNKYLFHHIPLIHLISRNNLFY